MIPFREFHNFKVNLKVKEWADQGEQPASALIQQIGLECTAVENGWEDGAMEIIVWRKPMRIEGNLVD